MLVAQFESFGYDNLLFFCRRRGDMDDCCLSLSYREIGDQTVCPTEPHFGNPMCLVSFLLFGGLLILKTPEIRMDH